MRFPTQVPKNDLKVAQVAQKAAVLRKQAEGMRVGIAEYVVLIWANQSLPA